MHPPSIEQISELSDITLARIEKEGLTPTPENYELWYIYYAESNPDVTRAVNLLISNRQKITEEHCLELHHRFLSEGGESEQVRKAGERVQQTIRSVTDIVDKVKKTTAKFNVTLTSAAGSLNEKMDKSQLEKIVKSVMSDTNEMIAQNRTLEDELSKSTTTMQELKREMEMVRREALTDSLTNLANRKSFDADIMRVAREAEEEGQTFTLIMLDIDHFKTFNDSFGHQVGDQVLRLVAKTLTDGVKGRDIAARYGGEEFAVILPLTNLQGGMKVADSLRVAVTSKDIVNRNTGEKLGRMTLSGGVAQYMPGEKIDDLIERADAALYTAKHNGRNQIAAAPMPGEKKAAG